MRNLQIIWFFAFPVILMLGACGKKGSTLIGQVPVQPVVNPDTRVLLLGHNLLDVRIDSNSVIKGLTDNNIFHSSDLFQQFDYAGYSLPQNTTFYNVNGNYISGLSSIQVPSTFAFSVDYGNNWNAFIPQLDSPAQYGSYYAGLIVSIQFRDNNTAWMLIGNSQPVFYQNYPLNSASLFRINLQTGQASFMDTVFGYYPVSMQFGDANTSWILLNKILPVQGGGYSNRNTYIIGTTDGGQSWTSPVLIDPNEPFNLAAGGDKNLFAYNAYGHAYASTDGGQTWRKSNAGFNFLAISMLNASLLYGLSGDGCIASEDGGLNWKQVSKFDARTQILSHIFFLNGKIGIGYSSQSLFITSDGGLSWKILLYPYSYIIR